MTPKIGRRLTDAETEKVAVLAARIAQLESELAEARAKQPPAFIALEDAFLPDNPDNDGTSYAHPAWWRGQEAGDRYRLAAVVTELSLILGVEIATEDLPKRWEQLKRAVAEARKDSERLDKLEAYPYAMEIKAITQYHKSDSVPSLRAQIDHFIVTEIDSAREQKGTE